MKPPKARWTVVALEAAVREANGILTDCQYAHVVSVVKRLCYFGNHEQLSDLRIEAIGDFWELKLKGHILGKINLRIYFAVRPKFGEIVVLKTYKKEEDHQLGKHIICNLEDRLEDYVDRGVKARSFVYKK